MKKVLRSFSFAWAGIKCCFVNEINFKCHCFFALTAIIFGFALSISILEWAVVLFAIAFVICLEIINTVVERACDVIHPEKSNKIKIIKDMAAASVLVSAIASFIVGAIIFLPKLF